MIELCEFYENVWIRYFPMDQRTYFYLYCYSAVEMFGGSKFIELPNLAKIYTVFLWGVFSYG